MAEQLAFQHRLGESATVNNLKRSFFSPTPPVDRLSNETLAGTFLAVDQHVKILLGSGSDPLEQGLHTGTVADNAIVL